jgi:hypothetical protein
MGVEVSGSTRVGWGGRQGEVEIRAPIGKTRHSFQDITKDKGFAW